MQNIKKRIAASGILLLLALAACQSNRETPPSDLSDRCQASEEADEVKDDELQEDKNAESAAPGEKQNKRRKKDFRERVSDYGIDRFHGNRHLRDTE